MRPARKVKDMTIKEMEEKTKMSRTNIRFYESEGLIQPKRRENGYREYSEEDAAILQKVKLLRSMDIPLEQVKAAAFGEKKLGDILEELDQQIDLRQLHQERTRLALRQMQQAGTEFDTLDPEAYFPMLERETQVEDAPPRLNLPWRRFLARSFDLTLYNTMVSLLLSKFIHREILITILTLAAMVFLEPLLLSRFGTTPGKAFFGIRVTDLEGKRLDYDTAQKRTWTVMWEGMAMNLPLISIYYEYKSFAAAEDEIPLSWEDDSDLTFKDDKMWRYLPFLLGHAALILVTKWTLGG